MTYNQDDNLEKELLKYKAVYPQAPIDMKYHYYDGDVLKIRPETSTLIKSIDELREYVKSCKGVKIAVDTETTGLTYDKDFVVGFSIAKDMYHGIYVPIRHQIKRVEKVEVPLLDEAGNQLYTKAGKARVKKVTNETALENPLNLDPKEALDLLYEAMLNSQLVLMHNSEFDLTMIRQEGYDVMKCKTFDTTILTYLYDSENKSWNKLKEASKIVLGRHPMKFAEALGEEENFRFVDLEVAYPYGASDALNTFGLFEKLYPAVKALIAKAPKIMTFKGDDKPYNVVARDNELIRAFTDYYNRVDLLVNTNTAKEYQKYIEETLQSTETEIYEYFNKGLFNLATGSKEFKDTMKEFHIVTGAVTDKGAPSYGKEGITEMDRNLGKLKDILSNFKNIEYRETTGAFNKRQNKTALLLTELIKLYGKEQFQMTDSANLLTLRTVEGIKCTKHEIFDELKLMYKKVQQNMKILQLIQKRSSLMKALNSYIEKLTQVDKCHMRYRLQGTASGRLSSGNGSKSDKRKNHYFIDLNAQNLTKPHSAYYKAVPSDEPDNILGWKFELVTEEYYHQHKDDEIIVEGSDPKNNIRNCLVAPKGRYILSLDYSAQEYLVLAILSGDHKMINNFKNGIDPHTATAYMVWGEEHYDRQKRKKAKGCVGDNTLISTTRGPVAVNNLLPTDKLIGVDGKPQNYVMTDYVGDLIDIEWSNGLKSSFTPNHPVQVWDGTKIRWKVVSCLTKDDEVISYVGNYNTTHKEAIKDLSDKVIIRNNKDVVKQFSINTPEFAYLAGLYLGDGTIDVKTSGAMSTVRFCADDNISDYVLSCITKLGLSCSNFVPVGKNKGTNVVRVCNKAYAELMNDLFGRTKGKYLNKELLSVWGKDELQHFLAGLVDSDGTTSFGGYISISNTVDEVIYAATRVANAVGIKCHVDKKIATLNGKKYPYKEVILYDLGDNILPIQNKNRIPSSKGRSRRGTWSVSNDYKEVLRKTICNGKVDHSLYDLRVCVRNIIDGHSKLNKSNLGILEKFGFEQPIKANMQCLKPLSFTKKVGHVNVIETENHTYIADGVGSHNCNFLMNYCGGAPTLAKNLNIPLEEAEDIIDKYEKGFFECIQWKQKSMRDCIERQNGVCFTLFGRPRQFKSRLTTAADLADMGMRAGAGYNQYTSKSTGMIKAVERRIISHHIQSTCGDICRWDLIRLYRKYFKHRNPDIDFMTTVHDEINFTATKEKAVDFAREIDDIMTITDFREDLPIKTSIDVGYTLGVLFPFEWEDETRQRLVPKRA